MKCPECKGNRWVLDIYQKQYDCPTCQGTGEMSEKPTQEQSQEDKAVEIIAKRLSNTIYLGTGGEEAQDLLQTLKDRCGMVFLAEDQSLPVSEIELNCRLANVTCIPKLAIYQQSQQDMVNAGFRKVEGEVKDG